MLRASAVLKNTRLDKGYEISEISKKLKIPPKHLAAIEEEAVGSFPSEPYCSLIVKDYSEFLGLNGADVLSLFRRDFSSKVSSGYRHRLFFSVTPSFTFFLAVITLIIIFTGYLLVEYFRFNRPPSLQVTWPKNIPTQSTSVAIVGFAEPESTVRINQDLVIVDPDGSFQKKISTTAPELQVTVESTSANGRKTIETRVLQRQK